MAKKSVKNKKSDGGKKFHVLAIVAFVLSLIFFFPPLSLIGGILGIVALVMINKNPSYKGKGLAIAAIIIGFLITLFYVALLIIALTLLGPLFSSIFSLQQMDIQSAADYCIEKGEDSFGSDICLMMVLSMHQNSTNELDISTCEFIETPDIKQLCLAAVSKDAVYCEAIEDPDFKAECLNGL